MTIDERLEFVATLQHTNEEHIGKLIEQGDLATERMDLLTERTTQAMDAINRLARIADYRDHGIADLENRSPS